MDFLERVKKFIKSNDDICELEWFHNSEEESYKRSNIMIDKELIDKLSIKLKEILKKEVEAGNEVVETVQYGFTNDSPKHIFVFLKYPFKTKIQNNLNEIIYNEINDRHYWKAEYTDKKNHQTLACNF